MRSGNVLWFLTLLALLLLCAVNRAEPPSARVALALSLSLPPSESCTCTKTPFGCQCGEDPAKGCQDRAYCPIYITGVKVSVRACPCSPLCTCGCNDGGECRCGSYTPPAARPQLVPRLMSFPNSGRSRGAAGGCSSGG